MSTLNGRVRALAVSLFLLAISRDPRLSAEERSPSVLAEAKSLFAKNCSDCLGRSKQGVLEGVRSVEGALEQGKVGAGSEREEAYLLLVQGYRDLAYIYMASKPEEASAYKAKLRASLKTLSEMKPENLGYLYEYSMTLDEEGTQVKLWRKMIAEAPLFLPARAVLGMYLVEHGEEEEGLRELRYAFEHASGSDARHFGQQLASALGYLGRREEAAKVQEKVNAMPDE